MRNPPVAVLRFDGLVSGAASVCNAGIPGRAVRESAVARPIDSPHSPAADRDLQRSFVQQKIFTHPQIVTTSQKYRRSGLRPWVFAEHGALMAANVLRSERAVQMSIFVIRAFVRLREHVAANAAILKRLAEIDRTLLQHDAALRDVYRKLQPLLAPPSQAPKRRIGF